MCQKDCIIRLQRQTKTLFELHELVVHGFGVGLGLAFVLPAADSTPAPDWERQKVGNERSGRRSGRWNPLSSFIYSFLFLVYKKLSSSTW
jgi:hypothetical protein